jgi:hypothetical protein
LIRHRTVTAGLGHETGALNSILMPCKGLISCER